MKSLDGRSHPQQTEMWAVHKTCIKSLVLGIAKKVVLAKTDNHNIMPQTHKDKPRPKQSVSEFYPIDVYNARSRKRIPFSW